jgi:drug/metabolite transporter (DMT)-like permease
MNPLQGILLKVGSVTMFVTMASLIKAAAAEGVPAGEAVFFRSILALPVIFVWLVLRGDLRAGVKTVNPMGHFWRGLVGTSAMMLMFAGLGLLPLPEATAIGYAAPILVVIFAAMFLGEEVRAFRLSAVALGLVGVLVVLQPRMQDLSAGVEYSEAFGAMLILAGAFCAALAQVFIRKLVQVERTASIVFWLSVTASALSLLTLPWGWVMPGPKVALLLGLSGLCGGTGQILLTSSYRYADASVIAPFEYSSMLLALIYGYAFFDEVPSGQMLIGAAIVISAGVLIISRERRLGLKRDRQRKAMTPQG